MPVRRPRFAITIAGVVGLLLGAVWAAPALADDPWPLVWTDAPGFPVVTPDYTTGFVLSETSVNPIGGDRELLDPLPLWLPQVTNTSSAELVIGLGIDIDTEGTVERMWTAEAWGIYADQNLHDGFRFPLAPGESLSLFDSGLPQWPGHTAGIFRIDESQEPAVVTEIARYTASGGFVPIHLDQEVEDTYLPAIGQELTVSGPSSGVEIFPGLTATASASGLPAGELYELWIAPEFDYFFFQLLGAVLPADASQIGSGTVAADGSLNATFELPVDLAPGKYQLLAGVRGDSYWPTGTWEPFEVVPLTDVLSQWTAVADGDQSVSLSVGTSLVELESVDGLPEMTFTATVSSTGPTITGFQLAGASSVFYHLSSSATLPGPVELCITYDPTQIPGAPPRLYHFEAAPPGPHAWSDITTTSQPGRVCGVTSTFSPFTLGYELDDGSTVKPAKGFLVTDNGLDNGQLDGAYNVVWAILRGENARTVRLLENGVVIAEQTRPRNTPKAQYATFPVAGRANGTYVYTAQLVNSRGTTTTSPLTVKVIHANPAKPTLISSGNLKAGNYRVTAGFLWGTNATSYTFYENGIVASAGALVAATPRSQTASLTLTGKPKGTYVYRVVFANAAGQTSSANLTVKVTK